MYVCFCIWCVLVPCALPGGCQLRRSSRISRHCVIRDTPPLLQNVQAAWEAKVGRSTASVVAERNEKKISYGLFFHSASPPPLTSSALGRRLELRKFLKSVWSLQKKTLGVMAMFDILFLCTCNCPLLCRLETNGSRERAQETTPSTPQSCRALNALAPES